MQSLIITNSGEELIAKLITGTDTARFTKFSASDHDYSGVDLETLTELDDIKQTMTISDVARIDTTTVKIEAVLDNIELESGYYIRALGLYAQDEEGSETLFAVSIEPDTPSYLPPFSEKTVSSINYTFNVKVSNSEQITIEVEPGANASAKSVEELKKDVKDLKATLEEQSSAISEAKAVAEAAKSAADTVKTAQKPIAFSVPVDAWSESENPIFPFFAEIADNSVTAADLPRVDFDKASILAAAEAGVIICETTAGKITLFAEKTPITTLSGVYTITKGGVE